MIRVTGDMHGEQARFLYSREERSWGREDIIIIAGDWGFLFFDNYSEKMFLNDLEQRPYTICFVDGNHENFHAIDRYPVEEWNGGKVHRIRKNIFYLMRGQVFAIEGKKIFTFGGAYSRDRDRREKNVSYWEEEIPGAEDYAEAIRNLEKHGYRVDYMITHTAPTQMIGLMGREPDPNDAELTEFFDQLQEKVEHRHWYCGHWHMDKDLTESFTVLRYESRVLR